MTREKLVTAGSRNEIWQQITDELDNSDLGYSFIICCDNRKIFLEIDIDPGGGFEGGYQFTKFKSQLLRSCAFRFSLHHEGFLDEIGKFFGMEDIETGYPNFDRKVVVKTNDPEKIKAVFSDEQQRKTIEELARFKFHITAHHLGESEKKGLFLELNIEEAITDMILLQTLYNTFYSVLIGVDEP